jgi:hypothetical protein
MEAMAALMAGEDDDSHDGLYPTSSSMGPAPGLDRRYGAVSPPPPEPEERFHHTPQVLTLLYNSSAIGLTYK